MAVIYDKLIRDYMGTPAGTFIQVLDKRYHELVVSGHFAKDSEDAIGLKKKKVKKNPAAPAAEDNK